jgi:hypothetical protein
LCCKNHRNKHKIKHKLKKKKAQLKEDGHGHSKFEEATLDEHEDLFAVSGTEAAATKLVDETSVVSNLDNVDSLGVVESTEPSILIRLNILLLAGVAMLMGGVVYVHKDIVAQQAQLGYFETLL